MQNTDKALKYHHRRRRRLSHNTVVIIIITIINRAVKEERGGGGGRYRRIKDVCESRKQKGTELNTHSLSEGVRGKVSPLSLTPLIASGHHHHMCAALICLLCECVFCW